ncbi:MAG: tRNA preQ1(34) S-adenosylmethionine ribosyltransferase-isomerase QueA [Archangium sp.]|nr:tRNA preQ1(34) S-adenosylmethionine ribosyltransferase-isomerase QueA [Archangium sp.]
MHTDDFDFQLPPELIAQAPLAERDASRLLHVRRPSGQVQHRQFRHLPSLLRAGDLLVFNDSRVIPARLIGKKKGTGGRAELLLVRPSTDVDTEAALKANAAGSVWTCLGQSSKGFRPGMELEFDAGLTATVLTAPGGGEYSVQFTSPLATLEEAIERAGKLPLPPYITRDVELADAERYQTVFARKVGSVAAPTAGLHFNAATFAELDAKGVQRCFVSLEVGPGTFMPVREGPVAEHKMHSERAHVSAATAAMIAVAKKEGRRVIAVGTTVVRTLESLGPLPEGEGTSFSTSIFITPGFRFQTVDAMVTNFHLPKSTLVMLVSAFLGREATLAAYAEAVREKYRFFSYGDAMFIESDS